MKHTLRRYALPVGVYLLLEWLFAYVTQTEGLLTPGGRPNLDVLAIGAAYLGTRLVVLGCLPVFAVFAASLRVAEIVVAKRRAAR
jgi:hypothetical protein